MKFDLSAGWRGTHPGRPAPARLLVLLALMLTLKIVTAVNRDAWYAAAEELPDPPQRMLAVIGSADPVAVARLMTLWLQAFDQQPGLSLSYQQLDYPRVIDWLEQILNLDPRGQYPLLLASRIYGEVNQEEKRRLMADLVYRAYADDPGRRWRWLAHSITVVRHHLGDLSLALKYAQALRAAPEGLPIPGWARQMEIFLREDMGEAETAAVMLGALIESGEVVDPAELRFLLERYESLTSE